MVPRHKNGCEARARGYRERGQSLSLSVSTSSRRSRLSLLLDPDTPFLELSQLAAHDVYPGEDIPGAGIITGIGRVAGKECVVVVNDATVKGGSYYPLTVRGVTVMSAGLLDTASAGKEAPSGSGNSSGTRVAMHLRW